MKDHRRRATQKSRRGFARCDHRIHSPDEKIGEPGFLALGGRIEDQRKSVAEQVQEKSSEHLDIAARVPDADLAVCRTTEAQTHKVAKAQGRNALRPIGPAPRRAPAFCDERRDGAVHRRAARIAPIQVGDDDFERVEGLVIKFPAHPASPDRIASKERVSALRSRVIQLPMDRFGHERIHGAGRSVDEARLARQKKPVPEKDPQEINRRTEHQLKRRRLPSLLQSLLGLEPCIGDFLFHLLVQGEATLVPEHPIAGNGRVAMISDKALMHDKGRIEPRPAPPHEPQNKLGPSSAADRLRLSV